jgi:hypothetical protein
MSASHLLMLCTLDSASSPAVCDRVDQSQLRSARIVLCPARRHVQVVHGRLRVAEHLRASASMPNDRGSHDVLRRRPFAARQLGHLRQERQGGFRRRGYQDAPARRARKESLQLLVPPSQACWVLSLAGNALTYTLHCSWPIDSGLRPSNVAEEENVRKFGQLDDASGNGGPASKDASGSNLGRSQSPGPQIDPSLGLRVNGKLRPPSGLPGGLDKGKRRASPDTPDHPHGLQSMAKRSRRDSPPTDWSSATQEGRYIVALNNAFESIREVVPALREASVP